MAITWNIKREENVLDKRKNKYVVIGFFFFYRCIKPFPQYIVTQETTGKGGLNMSTNWLWKPSA